MSDAAAPAATPAPPAVRGATAGLPLQAYALFHSRDVDEARAQVARIFCPHLLAPVAPGQALDARHHSALLHRHVSLNYVQYGPAVHIQPGYLKDFYLLQLPLRGSASVRCGGQQVLADVRRASLPSPTESLSMQWADDSPHLIVKLARQALHQQLLQLAQAPLSAPLVFDLALALDQPGSAALLQLVHGLRAMLDAATGPADTEQSAQGGGGGGGGGLGHAMLAEQAEGFLMSSLLLSAGHNHSAALQPGPQRHWLPRSVRRAEEYLASRLDQSVSLAELCQQVGVSARTLQAAFLQHRGEGPMVFWRHARLDRVHQLLRRGAVAAGAAPVAEVAARHGFLHAGRFAADYRRRFGESPSQTLARARH